MHDVAKSWPDFYRAINQYDGTSCRPAGFLKGESGYYQMRVNKQIGIQYATPGPGNFWIRKEKVADVKLDGRGGAFKTQFWQQFIASCEHLIVRGGGGGGGEARYDVNQNNIRRAQGIMVKKPGITFSPN